MPVVRDSKQSLNFNDDRLTHEVSSGELHANVCCPAPSWPSSIGKLSRETAIAFARSYVPGVETASAFAGEKRAFLACFSVAEVMVVSMVAVLG